jgi:hypothetical protein
MGQNKEAMGQDYGIITIIFVQSHLKKDTRGREIPVGGENFFVSFLLPQTLFTKQYAHIQVHLYIHGFLVFQCSSLTSSLYIHIYMSDGIFREE